MSDPTPLQKTTVGALKALYGRDNVAAHAPDARTGNIMVELICQAGVWEWRFDKQGQFIEGHLRGRLFDMPAQHPKPRNAQAN